MRLINIINLNFLIITIFFSFCELKELDSEDSEKNSFCLQKRNDEIFDVCKKEMENFCGTV
jgi:hypothetical protein